MIMVKQRMDDHTICLIMEAQVQGMVNFFEVDGQWKVAKGSD